MEKVKEESKSWEELTKDFDFRDYYTPTGEWIVMANPQNEPDSSGLYLPFSGGTDKDMKSAVIVAKGPQASRVEVGTRVILAPDAAVYTMDAFGLKWDMCRERDIAGVVSSNYDEVNKMMAEVGKAKEREHLAPKSNLSNLDQTTIN